MPLLSMPPPPDSSASTWFGARPGDEPPIHPTYATLSRRIADIPAASPGLGWLGVLGLGLAGSMVLAIAIMWLLIRGVGIWGINVPVSWGFAIINFVWWIGIGHAGTLISAILFLLRQRWRNSVNRFAEAMTLFAVANAAIFPLLHLGRPDRFYWLVPYPNTFDLWPQWRSPLVWDVFAIMTYGLVSLLFWYVGLLPDLATLRDRAPRQWQRVVAGVLALGWRGSARHWQRHQSLYLLLAGLATPLVVSVHSIVSLDFAIGIVPGWHTTVFPPFFVAGAIYSGMAMVLTLAIPIRRIYGVQDLITPRHLDVMARVMLVSGLIVAYGYFTEFFTAWYSGEDAERHHLRTLFAGESARWTFLMLGCNIGALQLLWSGAIRRSAIALFLISIAINVGMWTERLVIVVTPLAEDYVPSAWGGYAPTLWDWLLFAGSLGFFVLLFGLFLRLCPMISIYELREMLAHDQDHHPGETPDPSTIDEPVDPAPAAAPPVPDERLYGICAEFRRHNELLAAAEAARDAGYTRLDAFAPFPVEGLAEALGLRHTRIPLVVLIAGALGASGAFALQTYAAVFSWPWNIGGRPIFSWPSFVPLIFEVGILSAAVSGFVAVLWRCRLPQPYHPVMNTPGFDRASQDRFFLCIERDDPAFEREAVSDLFASAGALRVSEVER
jgi:Ni/Fe-hydrogenase subunit HybB-like protein